MIRNAVANKPRSSTAVPTALTVETMPAQALLEELLSGSLVLSEDLEALANEDRTQLARCRDIEGLVEKLVEHNLLTQYQADRIASGKSYGLVLGNYRVLDRLGAGGMGIVFKGEHIRLRQTVAIKVLPLYMTRDKSARTLMRFFAEVRAIAQLNHPNVVRALDAGEVRSEDPDAPVLNYFVMDYIQGQDLEEYVREKGPLDPGMACDIAWQITNALAEAHKHNLVHRDIKPSNIVIDATGKALLLDFGLVRHFRQRVTEPGTILGTIDYIAPEQAQDASRVDIRADIYGLGATLFWCLTGQPPFSPKGSLAQELVARQTQPPPSGRHLRPEICEELDGVLRRMMAPNPYDRYATPQAVAQSLLPFLKAPRQVVQVATSSNQANGTYKAFEPNDGQNKTRQHRVLVVDDDAAIRTFCTLVLNKDGTVCDVAENGMRALGAIEKQHYDLVLCDLHMPAMDGRELCQRLRQNPPCPNFKIMIFSGEASSDDLAQAMLSGADDFIAKPFSMLQLIARVKSALRLKDAQDRMDLLNRNLLAMNHQLEQSLNSRDSDLIHARNALVLALAELVTRRDVEASNPHLKRIQQYTRCLAEVAAAMPGFHSKIDPNFVNMIECCAPLKDIGKVGLPDHILLKPGRLESDERIIMQSHTIIGSETLEKVAKQHGTAVAFLQMAIDIARHHHERYDGKGYPDRLAGDAIPLAARIVAIADVYDALRSRRTYRPALSHSAAIQVIEEASVGQFDPVLLQAFERCHAEFDRIHSDIPD